MFWSVLSLLISLDKILLSCCSLSTSRCKRSLSRRNAVFSWSSSADVSKLGVFATDVSVLGDAVTDVSVLAVAVTDVLMLGVAVTDV